MQFFNPISLSLKYLAASEIASTIVGQAECWNVIFITVQHFDLFVHVFFSPSPIFFFHAIFHQRFADDISNSGMPKGGKALLTVLNFFPVCIYIHAVDSTTLASPWKHFGICNVLFVHVMYHYSSLHQPLRPAVMLLLTGNIKAL